MRSNGEEDVSYAALLNMHCQECVACESRQGLQAGKRSKDAHEVRISELERGRRGCTSGGDADNA